MCHPLFTWRSLQRENEQRKRIASQDEFIPLPLPLSSLSCHLRSVSGYAWVGAEASKFSPCSLFSRTFRFWIIFTTCSSAYKSIILLLCYYFSPIVMTIMTVKEREDEKGEEDTLMLGHTSIIMPNTIHGKRGEKIIITTWLQLVFRTILTFFKLLCNTYNTGRSSTRQVSGETKRREFWCLWSKSCVVQTLFRWHHMKMMSRISCSWEGYLFLFSFSLIVMIITTLEKMGWHTHVGSHHGNYVSKESERENDH